VRVVLWRECVVGGDGDGPREGDESSVCLWVGGSRRETSVFEERGLERLRRCRASSGSEVKDRRKQNQDQDQKSQSPSRLSVGGVPALSAA
jgi:hypothetical protein